MSHDDFLENLASYLKIKDGKKEMLQKKEIFKYQINCNKRAVNTANSLIQMSSLNPSGKNILDIGSGYGSVCLAFAEHGAFATGIEYNNELVQLSYINIKGSKFEKNINFINDDASSKQIFNKLPNIKFDLILLEDVFEHIYDTYGLIENISLLSTDGSFLYFNIPNGYYPDYIIEEVHKHKFGLTLLEPDLWTESGVDSGFSIYYKSWKLYETILLNFGFREYNKIWIKKHESKNLLMVYVKDKIKNIKWLTKNTKLEKTFLKKIEKYEYELNFDYNNTDSDNFLWKYGTPSWRALYTYEKSNPIKNVYINVNESIQCHIILYNISDSAEYEYAFYLIISGEIVEKKWYSNNLSTSFSISVTEDKNISVKVFVRNKKSHKVFTSIHKFLY